MTSNAAPSTMRTDSEKRPPYLRPVAHPEGTASWALPNPLLSTALARPSHPALKIADQTWTANQLLQRVRQQVTRLRAAGVVAGKRVALLAAPSAEWIAAWHAIGWLGAIGSPLPVDEARADVQRMLDTLQPDLLVYEADADSGLESTALRLPLDRGELPSSPISAGPDQERFWPIGELRAIIFSSGTTGRPRPIPLSTGQLLLSCFGSTIRLGHALDDVWLACLPLHHVGGLSIVMRCAWLGITLRLHPRFDAKSVATALDTGGATLVSLVPTMLQRVLDARPAIPFPTSLRAILVGGAETPATLRRRCREIGAPLAITWGMSEAASQVATRMAGDLRDSADSGPPTAFARVSQKEERLSISGPLVEGGRLLSSDLGDVDELGRVVVHARADDMIISGGEKIAPLEVEEVITAHPQVDQAAVIALASGEWGQRPVAFVVPVDPRTPPDTRVLVDWCRQRLIRYKVPDLFVSCAELPRNRLGKLCRESLRQKVIQLRPTPHGNDVAIDQPSSKPQTARCSTASLQPTVLDQLAQISNDQANNGLADRLRALRRWMQDDLTELEAQLAKLAMKDHDLAERAAAHLLTRPGKRVRPLCVLLATRVGRGAVPPQQRQAAQQLAVAAELVHAATLLHDDVLDQGTERRGSTTARVLFGNAASVLAGDHLLTEALRFVRRAGHDELLDSLLAVISEMVAAEALQLEQRRAFYADVGRYHRIVEGKTASLFRWAMRAGATLARQAPATIDALGVVGGHLGLAFQLMDDLLDLDREGGRTGKDAFADLRQGKITWPILTAAVRDPELGGRLAAIVAQGGTEQIKHRELAEIVDRILACGALEATRQEAQRHVERAKLTLAQLPSCRAKEEIDVVITYVVSRRS